MVSRPSRPPSGGKEPARSELRHRSIEHRLQQAVGTARHSGAQTAGTDTQLRNTHAPRAPVSRRSQSQARSDSVLTEAVFRRVQQGLGQGTVQPAHRLCNSPCLPPAPHPCAVPPFSCVLRSCGAMTHKTKDCVERPRAKGAKHTNKNIAADELVQDINVDDFEAKRDRWNGYDAKEYAKVSRPLHTRTRTRTVVRAHTQRYTHTHTHTHTRQHVYVNSPLQSAH